MLKFIFLNVLIFFCSFLKLLFRGPFTVSVVIYDDIALQEEAATHKYIDEIVVSNIELSQSESFSPAQSYNGRQRNSNDEL